MDSRSFLARCVMAGFGVGLFLFGCGGGGLSLTGYVDRLNAIGDRTFPQAEALISELERSATPRDVNATMERMVVLRVKSVEATEALDPPEPIADLTRHRLRAEGMLGHGRPSGQVQLGGCLLDLRLLLQLTYAPCNVLLPLSSQDGVEEPVDYGDRKAALHLYGRLRAAVFRLDRPR